MYFGMFLFSILRKNVHCRASAELLLLRKKLTTILPYAIISLLHLVLSYNSKVIHLHQLSYD